MRVVLAFDAFKGSLSAARACDIAHAVLAAGLPGAHVSVTPMADGGEGTLEALTSAGRGVVVHSHDISGPLPEQRVDAVYGWLPDERTAVIEMARASGLPLVPESKRNPLLTTTRGTGELLAAAVNRQARRILLTLGGSATCDGGAGAARALGWQFLDEKGKPVPDGGGYLNRLKHLVPPERNPLTAVPVEALCDVDNPLCGERGGAAVYGPQKGATADMVALLDRNLAHLADVIESATGLATADMPGAGAAGGFGAGAVAFFGAVLVPGVDAIARTVGLDAALAEAHWVVTGEGTLDSQSLQGKVLSGILRRARRGGTRIAVICGSTDLPEDQWRAVGIDALETSRPRAMSLTDAMRQADVLFAQACRRLARTLIGS